MYKGKTRLAARLLSIVLAAGMSVSGVSVSALAAEASDASTQQEAVTEQAATEEPEAAPAAEEENEEVPEVEAPAEPKAEAEVPADPEAEEIVEAEAPEAEEESIPAAVTGEVEAGDELDKKAIPETGWYYDEEEGEYYYYQDGSYLHEEVAWLPDKEGSDEVKLYGFNDSGWMRYDIDFYLYDEWADDEYHYRAHEDGHLYVNEWYGDDPYHDHVSYYDEDGVSVTGLVKLQDRYGTDMVLYCFSDEGWLMSNTMYIDDDGSFYQVSSNGVATLVEREDGWFTTYQGDIYYIQDGKAVRNTVLNLVDPQGHSGLFGFSDDGWLHVNSAFEILDEDNYEISFYRAKSAGYYGALYVNEWYQDEDTSDWYYYFEDGKAREGLQTVNGNLYVFDNDGRMWKNDIYTDPETGDKYRIDANGNATKISASGYKEGWNDIGGGVYIYVVNGEPVTDQVMKIGNSYYGFDEEGIMYDNTDFGMYDYEDYEYYYYRAKSGGALIVNNWYQSPDKDWYYYGAEGKGAEGIVTLGGVTYAFDCARMLTDTEYEDYNTGDVYRIAKNGVAKKVPAEGGWFTIDNKWYYYDPELVCYSDGIYDIKGTKYGFNYKGVMYDNCRFEMQDSEDDQYHYYHAKSGGALTVNNWGSDHGFWYYYGADGAEYGEGKYTIGKINYYFNWAGRLFTNGNIVLDGILYHADANGVLSVANGLCNTEDGGLVYAENGQVVTNAWKSVNGKRYYFDDDGYAATGIEYIDGKYYYFDSDHVMAKNVWVDRRYEGVIYVTADGTLAEGEQVIGGKYYYFGERDYDKGRGIPYLLTGIVEYDGNTYLCGPDGAWIATVSNLKDGWFNAGGTWYYIEDKQLVIDEEKTISGADYYFDYDGEMVIDKIYGGKLYGNNGVRVKSGWYQLDGEWVYVDPATGQCVNEEQTINGKQYYFRYYRMVTGDTWVNGEKRTYGSDGALKGTIPENQNGWTLYNGRYYYYENGEPVTGWRGNYYIEDGVMATDTVIDGYYVNDVGLWVRSAGWVDGGYMYVKSNGMVASEEWVKISGQWYYFGYYGNKYSATTLEEDGYVYIFDYNGRIILTIPETDRSSRWISANGGWYYWDNGWLARYDILNIGGTVYAFDYSGRMITNGFYDGYYFTSSGARANYTGWKQINGKWFYFDDNHYRQTGWIVTNGASYYLDYNYGMVTGNRVINGRLYNFNSSGALTGPVSTQNGWVQCGSDWCYIRNGAPLSYGIYKIGNTWYGFKNGRMAVNEIVEAENGDYYVNGSGIVSFNKGWRQIGGTWYYFDQGGKMLRGLQYVDGTLYNLQGYGYYYGE